MKQSFESEWQARFERFARRHEEEARISGWSEAGLKLRLRAFSSLVDSFELTSPAAALDVGCGAGSYVRLLAGLGHRAIGVDYSHPSLTRAVGADPGLKGRYLAGEAYGLPFRNEAFDLVLSIGMFQALAAPERALDEMVRLLRPGGILVVEALNERAIASRMGRGLKRLKGRRDSVRVYDPRSVGRWISQRGIHLERRLPICLPPRRLPVMVRLLERGVVRRGIEGSAKISELVAHTFLFVGRKPDASANLIK
jgi:SAM-dependent methyltransferase